jgi:O-antigen ligase
MGGFFLASALAALTAVDPSLSLKELRNVFQPAFFYLLVNHLSEEEHTTTLVRVLIAGGTVISLYGLSQAVSNGAAYRIHGTLSIYMTFAGVLMLIAAMAVAQVLFHARDRHTRWLGPALLPLTAALLMTQTRGAWLGLTVGVSFLLWVRKKYLLLVFPVIAVAIFLAAPPSIKSRIGSFLDPTDLTFNERLFMWHSGLQLIREHPWTGVGMDGLKRVYPAYKYPGALKEHTGHLHNNLLQIGAERGLIGLAFWLWIWVSYVRQAWGVAASLPPQATGARALVLGSLASVASFHVAGLSEYTFGDSEVVMLVYFLMALPFLIQKHGATRCAKV